MLMWRTMPARLALLLLVLVAVSLYGWFKKGEIERHLRELEEAWLAEDNFDASGQQRRSLAEVRAQAAERVLNAAS